MDLSCSDFSSTSRRFFSAYRSQPTVRSPARAVRCPPCATCGSPGARGARGATVALLDAEVHVLGAPLAILDPPRPLLLAPRAAQGSVERGQDAFGRGEKVDAWGKRSARGSGRRETGGARATETRRAARHPQMAERTTTAREGEVAVAPLRHLGGSSLAPYGMMNAGGSCRSLPLRARDVRAARVATRRSRAVEQIGGSFRACSGRIVAANSHPISGPDWFHQNPMKSAVGRSNRSKLNLNSIKPIGTRISSVFNNFGSRVERPCPSRHSRRARPPEGSRQTQTVDMALRQRWPGWPPRHGVLADCRPGVRHLRARQHRWTKVHRELHGQVRGRQALHDGQPERTVRFHEACA